MNEIKPFNSTPFCLKIHLKRKQNPEIDFKTSKQKIIPVEHERLDVRT